MYLAFHQIRYIKVPSSQAGRGLGGGVKFYAAPQIGITPQLH
jgi:hypothetical protein